MKKLLLGVVALWFAFAPAVNATNVNIDGLPTASSVTGTSNLFECEQSGTNNQCTSVQIAAYIYGLMNGDATASGTGGFTLATVNSNVGTFGSATQCLTTTQNAKGLTTAISATTCTPAVTSVTGLGTGVATFLGAPSSANLLAALTTSTGTGVNVFGTAPTISSLNATTAMTLAFLTSAGTQCLQVGATGVVSGTGAACGGSGSTGANPTATASDTAVNGVATTFMRSDGAPAIQKTSASQFGLAKVDGSTITATAGVISAAVFSVSSGIGVTCSPTTGSVVCGAPVTVRNNTATSDTITSTDKGTVVTESNASSVAVAITTTGFVSTDYFTVKNLGAGVATYTPSSGTIDGAGTLVCSQNQSADLYFDGTNYKTLAKSCGLGTLATTTPGANVATAAAVALSGAGGLTSTIASGTATGGTSAIASAACGTVITVSATNVATTDVVTLGFNGDPTAIVGFVPATAGMLTVIAYPTSGNINIKECNNTSSSITPGAHTYNWRVVR